MNERPVQCDQCSNPTLEAARAVCQAVTCPFKTDEQRAAEAMYPDHAPSTALANYRAGREVWDTNGDIW